MFIETLIYSNESWKHNHQFNLSSSADIVFIYGEREAIKKKESFDSIKQLYPNAKIVGCSSSGNILGDTISTAVMVATAVEFEQGFIEIGVERFDTNQNLIEVSQRVVSKLPKKWLKHIYLLSDGLQMNGSDLAKGANQAVDYSLPITGGLAGDGTDFKETWVIANQRATQNTVIAVGFYGEKIHISSGCYAGWNEFGILRRITKSEGNIVYEIDHQPALDLYKKYLGEYAKELPSSGLRFPFNIKKVGDNGSLIRSVLAIDEAKKALIFAGDVPEGSSARLMKTHIDGLIDGSEIAARRIKQSNSKSALGLVVNCIGRRLILKQLSEEELESISTILGQNVQLIGFYSYGELAPYSDELLACKLHNQTMTLTVIYED